jgi:hypothetical protein
MFMLSINKKLTYKYKAAASELSLTSQSNLMDCQTNKTSTYFITMLAIALSLSMDRNLDYANGVQRKNLINHH